MTKPKPITPYERLRSEAAQWAFNVANPIRRRMYTFQTAEIDRGDGWKLCDVKQRVQAADQLGWNVEIVVDTNGDLVFRYVQRPPDAPWSIRT